MDKYVVVLAAGKGTGMNSRDPEHSKVSYPILGKPIINYVIDAVKPLDPKQIVTVVGFGGELTSKLVKDESDIVCGLRFAICAFHTFYFELEFML